MLSKALLVPQQLEVYRIQALLLDRHILDSNSNSLYKKTLHRSGLGFPSPDRLRCAILTSESMLLPCLMCSLTFKSATHLCSAVIAQGWPISGVCLAAGDSPLAAQALQRPCREHETVCNIASIACNALSETNSGWLPWFFISKCHMPVWWQVSLEQVGRTFVEAPEAHLAHGCSLLLGLALQGDHRRRRGHNRCIHPHSRVRAVQHLLRTAWLFSSDRKDGKTMSALTSTALQV